MFWNHAVHIAENRRGEGQDWNGGHCLESYYLANLKKKIAIWTSVMSVGIKMNSSYILGIELVGIFDGLVMKVKKVSTKQNRKFRKIAYYLEKFSILSRWQFRSMGIYKLTFQWLGTTDSLFGKINYIPIGHHS